MLLVVRALSSAHGVPEVVVVWIAGRGKGTSLADLVCGRPRDRDTIAEQVNPLAGLILAAVVSSPLNGYPRTSLGKVRPETGWCGSRPDAKPRAL